jgi:type II secretory pathway component PulF
MVAVGESTGDLPQALRHAARRFDRELSARIQKIMALIQPVIIVIVALMVGAMVYLVISAIFQSFSSFGKIK